MIEYPSYITYESLWNKSFPSHWSVLPMYALAKEKSIYGCVDLPLLSVYLDVGVIPFSAKAEKRTNVTSKDLSRYQRVDYGDFVLNNQQAWRGSVGISYDTGIVSPAYIVLSMNDTLYSRYANYLLRSRIMVDQYLINSKSVGSIQRNIYWPTLKRTSVLVPPREEQDQIVRYLDWKVSSINKLINTLRKKESLLRELQRRYNNDAMRPREGWTSGPLKKYALSNQESLSANTPNNTQIRYIDISTVGNGYLKTAPVPYVLKDAPLRARRVVHSGDTIISTVRTYLRSVCFLSEQYEGYIASTGFSVLTPKRGVMPELLGYALTSDNFISQVIKESIGVSYPAISDNKLMRLNVVFPSNPSEQKCLVERIYNMNQHTNSVIKTTESQIESLKDLKIRLIADVVTGQMDVRNIYVPEYEHVDNIGDDGCEDASEDEDFNGEAESACLTREIL